MRDLSQYDNLRPLIETADLIEFASNGLIGSAIMEVTGGKASHSSLVIRLPYKGVGAERRYIVESNRTGPDFHLLSDVLQSYDGKIIWYGLKPEFNDKRDAIGSWLFHVLSQHKKYDFKGVALQLFCRVSLDARRLYCTELCEVPYIEQGIVKPDPKGARRPGDLPKEDVFIRQETLWG